MTQASPRTKRATQLEDRDGKDLRVALLQTDPLLGEVDTNLAALRDQLGQVGDCDVAVAPELALNGYHLGMLQQVDSLTLDDPRLLALGRYPPALVAGFVERRRHDHYNSAAVIDAERLQVQRKLYLPTYRAWEEGKHFKPGSRLRHFDLRGAQVAVLICNDLWQPPLPWLAVHGGLRFWWSSPTVAQATPRFRSRARGTS